MTPTPRARPRSRFGVPGAALRGTECTSVRADRFASHTASRSSSADDALVALYHVDFHLGIGSVAKVVLGKALIPLLLGLVTARRAPRFAAAAGPWLLKIINIVLLVVVLFALIVTGIYRGYS